MKHNLWFGAYFAVMMVLVRVLLDRLLASAWTPAARRSQWPFHLAFTWWISFSFSGYHDLPANLGYIALGIHQVAGIVRFQWRKRVERRQPQQ